MDALSFPVVAGTKRSCDCAGGTPSARKSLVDGRRGCPYFTSPFANQLRSAIHSNWQSISTVMILLLSRRPFYIARFVVTIYIDTIKTMLFSRTATNDCNKFLKRVKSKLNAATSPLLISRGVRVITSSFSIMIGAIFGRDMSTGFAVYNLSLPAQTSARPRIARTESSVSQYDGIATLTATEPHAITMMLSCIAQHGQSSILMTGQVNKPTMCREWKKRSVRILLRHKFLLYRNLCLGLRDRWCGCVSRFYYTRNTALAGL